MRSGIFDSMNSATVPIVPANIRRTFQSMAEKTDPSGIAPETTKMTAEISATYGRFLGRAIIRIYVIAKRMMVNSFMTGLLTFLFHFFREYFTAARGSGQPDKIAGGRGAQSAKKVIFPFVMTVMMSAIIHTTVTMRETFASAAGSSTKDRIDST